MTSTNKQTQQQNKSINRSQPSTACRPCRDRRAKCDRGKPSCSQCIRSSRKCCGYRDSFDLVLRDRTKTVAQKYGVLSLSRSNSPPEQHDISDEDIPSLSRCSSPSNWIGPKHDRTELQPFARTTSPPRSLLPSIRTVSVAAFIRDLEGIVYLDYIPGLLASNEWSAGLQQCVEAVSLMYFSHSNPNPSLLPEARVAFRDAVQNINEALTYDNVTDSDSILASVMLLALYSTFSSADSQNLWEWNMHFEGAIALLSKRSPDSFSSRHAQLVLTHILSYSAMHVFRSKQRMPARFHKLFQHSVQMDQPIQIDFWDIIGAVIDLQHLLETHDYHALDVIIEAHAIDQRLEALYNKIVYSSDQEGIRASYGLSGEFPLSRQIQSLNTLRVGRLRLNSIIHSHTNICLKLDTHSPGWDFDSLTALATSSVRNADSMAEQIHQTIPETFRPSCKNPYYPSNSNAWICSFVWPLMEILSSTTVSGEWLEITATQLSCLAKSSDNSVISSMALESARGTDYYQKLSHVFYIC